MTYYDKITIAASNLAKHLHAGQKDKGGADYFKGHLSSVAAMGRTWKEKVAGFLHDAAEDTPYSVEEVLNFLEEEAAMVLDPCDKAELTDALHLLNHHEQPDRKSYIEAIGTNALATGIKLNDLRNNMDISRIACPCEKDYKRLERYRFEYAYLLSRDVKPILYIDMDNVLVNFQSGIDRLDEATRRAYEGRLDEVPDIFALMDPVEGAVEAVHRLSEWYDVYILTTAPWHNPPAWMHKVEWVQRYFGKEKEGVLYKRLIISHHKNLNRGDIIIDDRTKNGVDRFKGRHIHFGSEDFPDWESVLEELINSAGRHSGRPLQVE